MKWISFTTDTNLECAYTFDKRLDDYKIKILSKVGKVHYYSCLNQAGEYFDEIILPTLNKNIN